MACSQRWYFPWLPCEFSKDSMKFGMLQKPSKLAGNLNLPYNLDVIPKVFCSLVPVVFPSCLLYWHSVQIFLDPWPRSQQNNFHFGQLWNFQKLLLLEFQVKRSQKNYFRILNFQWYFLTLGIFLGCHVQFQLNWLHLSHSTGFRSRVLLSFYLIKWRQCLKFSISQLQWDFQTACLVGMHIRPSLAPDQGFFGNSFHFDNLQNFWKVLVLKVLGWKVVKKSIFEIQTFNTIFW